MKEDPSSSGSLNKSWLNKLSQFVSSEPNSREDLINILRNAQQNAILDIEALSIIEGAIQVSDMQVREIMIPRSQMISVTSSSDPQDFLPTVIESAHSRFPVFSDNPDEVIGILLAKDLLPIALEKNKDRFLLKDHVRPVAFVPESKRLNILLDEFKANRNHMAIVLNEYNGVAGLVTIEDVLEQIVGEIEDETDIEDDDYIVKALGKGEFVIKALMPVDEFNEQFKTEFSDDIDTIGGAIIQKFGRVPKRDDALTIGSYEFTVLNADNRTIKLLQIKTATAA